MFSLKNTKTKRSCRTLSQTSTNIKDFYFGNNDRFKRWVKNNKTHRLHGPAKIWYYETGLIHSEAWYENGILHRLHGPAEIRYNISGLIGSEWWFKNDKAHRLNGPAYIRYYETGLIQAEEWYENDKKNIV